MDGAIVTVSLIDTITSFVSTGDGGGFTSVMKIFRIARVLRPLRLISRNENLKIVVRTIHSSLDELGKLVMFSVIFFFNLRVVGHRVL